MAPVEVQPAARGVAENPYAAIIFDMDGLLLDTETIYTACFDELFASLGATFDQQFKTTIMGLSSHDTAEMCTRTFKLPLTAEEFQQRVKALQLARFPSCVPMPGAQATVGALRRRALRLAVATSSMESTFRAKTGHHPALFAAMDVIVTGDDPAVRRGKPAPDIYLEAARRLAVRPEHCLAFEDSPNGVRAARAAGMPCIWIPDAVLDYTGPRYADLGRDPGVLRLASLEHFDLDRCHCQLQKQAMAHRPQQD